METTSSQVHIATAEAVALEVDVAGPGHRILAWTLDAWIIFIGWSTVAFVLSYLRRALGDVTRVFGLEGSIQVLIIFALFATNWCYGLLFEAFGSGQTPGKRLMGLRVVREDGSPATFLDVAIRNFCRGIDFLPAFYAVGVFSMVLSERTQRVGDRVAGTLVIRISKEGLALYEQAPFSPELGGASAPRRVGAGPQAARPAHRAGRSGSKPPGVEAGAAAWTIGFPRPDRASLSDPGAAEAFLRALAGGQA